MQQTSDLYRQILADSSHVKRHRLFVDGLEYGHSNILRRVEAGSVFVTQPPEVTGSLFANGKPGIGSCVAKQLDILLLLQETPPPMAEIRLETQLVLTDPLTGSITAESEWIPKGTFFIDTRRHIDLQDKAAPLGALLIHGYDAMLKAEQVYLPEGDTGTWPRSMSSVVGDIASRMGVSVDSRTVLNGAFNVGYPGDYTMREILGYIAVANGGNWVITDANELRLIKLASIPLETSYLVSENGDEILFGGVKIRV